MRASLLASLATLILVGCDDPTSPPVAPPAPVDETGTRFDPARTGAIEGVVRWKGKPPDVPAFRSLEFVHQVDSGSKNRPGTFDNPNAPRIGSDGSLEGAVVVLHGVDPRKGRKWDHPPARVELANNRLTPRVAFVRTGEMFVAVSRDAHFHMLQGRGAAYFGLALPEAGRERVWRLDAPGVVELRSGAGFFWMRGHFIVSDHPYVALTERDGAFRIGAVPAGVYELAVTHPSWQVIGSERNVDNLRISQVTFGAWLETRMKVSVEAGKVARVEVETGEP